MARFGFIGPSSTSRSPNADAQKCVNLYVEMMESEAAKSRMVLYATPGLKAFCDLGGAQVRGSFETQGRYFAVADGVLWEVMANGATANRGAVANDGKAVTFAVNNANQLLLTSGGIAYLLNLMTNVLSQPVTGLGAVASCAYNDGYFILLLANSQRFQLSALLDGTTWDPLDVAQVLFFADNVVEMKVDHRELWLFGPKQTTVYYDSGNPDFPFEPIPGAFIEQGATGPATQADNTLFWWGADERGAMVAWRANAYTPARVSNHGVEFAVQNYAVVNDYVSFAYQDQGHTFWVTYFPTANKTWVYDVATQMWHERGYWSDVAYSAHRARCHSFAFGKHLVGDRASGKIYEMSILLLDDDGAVIRRLRRSPHVSAENEWTFHSQLQIDMETGVGPQPPLLDGAGKPRGPQLMLRWSDDGGHTWSNEYTVDVGQAGEYRKRAMWRRLGRTRDRIYEITATDPVAWSFIEAYLQATPNYPPTERISAQLGKGA